MAPITTEDLKKVIALNDLPEEHLKWLAEHCEVHEYSDGEVMMTFGDPAELMWFIPSGKFAFYMDVNGVKVHYFDFENNKQTGGVGGLLPYSRMKTSPGYSIAVGQVTRYSLHKKYFTELEQLNPDFIQRLIGYMTERARHFATTQLQHEKVNALGNLAAGIAHELNNPAAAINRIANELTNRLDRNYALTEKLLQCNVKYQDIQGIRTMVENKGKESSSKTKITAMQRMRLEDELSDWLEDNGINNREAAETFVESGFSPADLDSVKNNVGKDAFNYILPWLENLVSSRHIIKDLEEASGRISRLVGAIKSHVHMDRTSDLQSTNVHNDIENTLTLLGFKLRAKNIEVKKKFCDDMTEVPAYVGELNQVWTNLIDNAIYAVPQNGEITIETSCRPKDIKVCIIDNGAGIPKEIMSRIFDPFFTTKKQGDGTGIGLDLVNRIIKHHNADIKVESEPGKTKFIVCIPRAQVSKSNGTDAEQSIKEPK